jgi:hypothetical protein
LLMLTISNSLSSPEKICQTPLSIKSLLLTLLEQKVGLNNSISTSMICGKIWNILLTLLKKIA